MSWAFQMVIIGSFLALAELSAYAGEKEGCQLTITSPRNGEIVGSTVSLTYTLQKGTKGNHIYAFVDGQYQKDSKAHFKD